MKGNQYTNVCRVCLGEGVLLDLFGDQSQKVSYVDDVNRCLSIKIAADDGLPTKICVKCVGLLSDCNPFVERILKLGTESSSLPRSCAEDICYFCLSSENHLFPVPENSVHITKQLFEIDVPEDSKICHRCQFHLDTVHDLKMKACASLKHFYSNTLSPKKKASSKNVETVQSVLKKLSNTYIMEDKENPHTRNLVKQVTVELVDIGPYLISFAGRTVNMREFSSKLQNSTFVNGSAHASSAKRKAGPLKKTQPVREEPSVDSPTVELSGRRPRKHSLKDDPIDSSEPFLSSKKVDGRKRSRQASDSSEPVSSPKKFEGSKRSREDSNSDNDTVSKKGDKQSVKFKALKRRGRPPKPQQITPKLQKTKKAAIVTTEEIPEEISTSEECDGNVKEADSSTKDEDSIIKDIDAVSGEAESSSEVAASLEKETSKNVEETESTSKRRKRKTKGHYFEQSDEETPPRIKRKRKNGEDGDFFNPKGRGKKIQNHEENPSYDSGVDEPVSSGNELMGNQPAFLKELDDLMKSTPKTTFRPFICSVCHEGYVSTVKGKLHKLVAHDPRATNFVLKLKPCDDEVKQYLSSKLISAEEVGNCSSREPDADPSYDLFSSSNIAKDNTETAVNESDDLFSSSIPVKKTNLEATFDDLFSSSIEKEREKDTESIGKENIVEEEVPPKESENEEEMPTEKDVEKNKQRIIGEEVQKDEQSLIEEEVDKNEQRVTEEELQKDEQSLIEEEVDKNEQRVTEEELQKDEQRVIEEEVEKNEQRVIEEELQKDEQRVIEEEVEKNEQRVIEEELQKDEQRVMEEEVEKNEQRVIGEEGKEGNMSSEDKEVEHDKGAIPEQPMNETKVDNVVNEPEDNSINMEKQHEKNAELDEVNEGSFQNDNGEKQRDPAIEEMQTEDNDVEEMELEANPECEDSLTGKSDANADSAIEENNKIDDLEEISNSPFGEDFDDVNNTREFDKSDNQDGVAAIMDRSQQVSKACAVGVDI